MLLALRRWLGSSHFRDSGTAALVALITARLTAVLPHWTELASTVPERLLTVLDVRAGSWSWPVGVAEGLVYLLTRLRQWPPALTRSLLVTLTAAALPLLLSPAPHPVMNADHVLVTRVSPQGATSSVAFKDLRRPAVVNVWATWCGPCRVELPVLARALRAGEPTFLINGGERPAQLPAFLDGLGVFNTTFVDDGALRQALQVSGYPSTCVISPEGQATAQHLAPLNAV